VEGKHFIYFVGAERTPRVPALLSQEGDVAELRCNMCSHGKLRALRGIRRHVTDKYATPSSLFFWFLLIRLLIPTDIRSRHRVLQTGRGWSGYYGRRCLRLPKRSWDRWAHNIGSSGIEVYGRFLRMYYTLFYSTCRNILTTQARFQHYRVHCVGVGLPIEILFFRSPPKTLARATHLLITHSWFDPSSARSGRLLMNPLWLLVIPPILWLTKFR
jgi:hypothetical protein